MTGEVVFLGMFQHDLVSRMRMDREKLILGVRNINMDEGRSFIKRFVQVS